MSASGSKPYECLICAAPIYNTNLGIDACRACTVFYRRHLNSSKPLLCRKGTDDCFEKNTRPLCRKCRFVRFSVVLAQSTAGRQQTVLSLTPPSDNQSSIEPIYPNDLLGSDSSEGHNSIDLPEDSQCFLDHRSFDLFSSCTHDSSFFDRLRKAYTMLCVVRRCGEMGIVEQDEETSIQGDGMKFYCISHAAKIPALRILFGGLIQFFESTFDDFHDLPGESKNYILDKCIKIIHTLDGLYRCVHHFPDQDNLSPSYMTYINLTIVEGFVAKFNQTHMKDIVHEMKNNFTRSVELVRSCFKRVNPSNEEFLAMIGLCLWSNDISRVNDDYVDVIAANRSAILSELHKLYTSQGIANYSARLGDLLCLLETIEKNAQKTEEDVVIIKLMSSMDNSMEEMTCGGK